MPVKISVNLNETASPAAIQLIIEKAGTKSIMASRKFIAGLKKRNDITEFFKATKIIYMKR
ncbi:MAG: hypothetical protein JRI86_05195 [Deltaproteobacteria bacterium]|nr:hypothetical protein [Deltaproteobacteria bacterium]